MHNRPINNETDLIRGIFSKSLNENRILLEAGPKGKGRDKEKGKGKSGTTGIPLDKLKAEREAEIAAETPTETPAIEVGGVAEPTKIDWSSLTGKPEAANIPGVEQGKTTKADLPQDSDKTKTKAKEPERTGNVSNILKALAASAAGVMGVGTVLGSIAGAAGLSDKNATVSGVQKAFVPAAVPAAVPGAQQTRPSPSTPTSADTGKIASLSIPTLPASMPSSQSLLDLAFKGRVGTAKTSGNTVLAAKPESPSKSKDVISTIQAITTKASTPPFEAPPEPDQKVYNYPGSFVGSEATSQLQSKVDSSASLETLPEPDQIKSGANTDNKMRKVERPKPAPQPAVSRDKTTKPKPAAPQFYPGTIPQTGRGYGLRTLSRQSAILAPLESQPQEVRDRVYSSMNENYYNILSQRLNEAKTEPSGAQVNQAAYGFDPRGGRNARKALASLKSGMWRGDSTSSGKIRSETKPSPIDSQFQPSWGEKLKPHVITLMSAAQDHKIELSKEEAVNPGSKDHQRLLSMYPKDHDVHKASQAVGEIMRSRSNA